MPNPLNVPITPPRVAFIDPRSGTVSREWYLFFLSLFQSQGGSSISLDDVQKGPPVLTVDEINANISKVAENLHPSTESTVEQIAELRKQVDGLDQSPESCCANEIAELQKQIDALETQVRPELGTMSQLQQSLLPWVIWDTTPEGVPPDVGTLAWDGGTTLGVQMTTNVLGRVNESGYYYIKASSAITKGQVIMFTGAVGASGVPTGAPATGVTDGSYIMGIAAESIANNGFGLVQFIGTLRGVDLSAYSDGDILWYNPAVTGGLTKTKPSAPNVKVQVAAVISNSNNGTMLIRVTAGSELGGTDSNVQFGTLANGDLIQYDSALGYWKNVPATTVGVTSFSAGTTGFTPSTVSTGAVTLAGTLKIANGGTGVTTTPANGQLLIGNGTGYTVANLTAGSGVTISNSSGGISIAATGTGGTVTSVGLSMPTQFAVTNSPVTGSGTLTAAWNNQTANNVLAGPTTGAAAAPTFRTLVAADIPTLPYQPTAAPATYTANFSVAASDVWVINNKPGSSCTVTLPSASANTGRVLRFQNYQAQTLVSASSNVVPLVGGAAGTAILAAVAGDTCTLVSDGTNWIMTQYVPNNVLLLE